MSELSPPATRHRSRVSAAYWLFLALLAAVALTGGTSRYDSLSQVLVRTAAVLAMIGWALLPRRSQPAPPKLPFVFLALVAAAILVQLVPLPPSLWTAAAGRDFYAGIAPAAGLPQPWRPLNLSPERGWGSLFSLLVPLATLVGLSMLSERRRLSLVLPLIVLILVSAVLGLAQLSTGQNSALRWYAYSSDRFAAGLFANRNHQAVLLSFALPLLAIWALERRDDPRHNPRHRAVMALGVGMFVLLMIPTTGSRAGFVVVIAALLGAVALSASPTMRALRRMPRRRRRLTYGAAASALAVFAVVAWLFGRNDAFHRIRGLDVAEDLRARVLPTLLEMTRTFFPVGSGVGSLEPVYRRFEPFEQLSTSYLNMAHNDLLQVVLEAGALGAALLGAFVVWWLVRAIAVWRATPSSAVRAGRAGSIMIALLLAASAVDYPVRTPLMMMLITIAAIWLEQAGKPIGNQPLTARPRG